MTIKIKSWEKFQHFKDRKPPWIKLYRDILDDIEWHQLNGDDAKMLVMLWLIGSENDGSLPDIKELAFRLRTTEKSIKSTVSRLWHWLRQDDIKVISDDKLISGRYQDDITETSSDHPRDISVKALTRSQETETETETEGEGAFALPPFVDAELWNSWVQGRKNKKISDLAAKIAVNQLTEWHARGLDANAALRKAVIGGHQGLYEPDQRTKNTGPKPIEDWFIPAGFDNVHEARNAGCSPSTAKQFRDGKRLVTA